MITKRPPFSINETTDVTLLVPDGEPIVLSVTMSYAADDPLAIWMIFSGDDIEKAWAFARDLLMNGRTGPTGGSDVHIWPSYADGRRIMMIGLNSPDGIAMLKIDIDTVDRFLNRTLQLVPIGAETANIDVDSWIKRILG